MNKWIPIILLFTSCSIISSKKQISRHSTQPTKIYANIANPMYSSELKMKTKINICTDSIKITLFHALGIQLGSIILKEDMIWVDQRFKEINDTINLRGIKQNIDIKKIRDSWFQQPISTDSIIYNHILGKVVFKKYIIQESFVVPEYISFFPGKAIGDIPAQHLQLEYKSISF